MLLKEDGHLDIERIRQLNEEELEEEMRTWGNNELFEWEGRDGTLTLEEFYATYRQKIKDMWSK